MARDYRLLRGQWPCELIVKSFLESEVGMKSMVSRKMNLLFVFRVVPEGTSQVDDGYS